MFPKIPENLAALSATELRALATEIRTSVKAALENDEATKEDLATAESLVGQRKEILALAATKENLTASEMSESEEEVPVVEEPAAEDLADAEEAEAETEEEAAGELSEEAEAEVEDPEPETEPEVEASVKPKVRTSTGVEVTPETPDGGFTPDKLLARGGVSGLQGGTAFTSWLELAETLVDVGSDISDGSSVKVPVAFVPGNFTEEQQLGENMTQNLRKFEPEIMAAMCAPAVNTYDLDCWNTDRRPVRNSMAAFKPDARGAVTIYPSPSLTDITDQSPAGVGVWNVQDDASIGTTDPSSKACATIACADPVLYRLYGIWRCLTVQNLLAMTFPELVEAYLNRLAASHSRLAETQLLEAMGTATVAVTQSDLGYGSSVSITTTIMNMLALHQETERWDNGESDAWVPRWVLYAMKMDMVRRRNTSGGGISVPSDSEITRMFNDAGVTPHWFIDTPTWASAIPAVQTAGVLNLLPSSVEMVIAPRGKFAVMDRGELSIGVTGNGMYRDNASNASNNFTFFFENFEALVDTNSCPAYLLTVEDLCHNGIQIADEVLDCDGGNTIS